MVQRTAPHGIRVFILIWFGQLVSLIGSGLTGFALGVWVYQQTGSVTQFALISLFTSLPGIIISPLAGALVDRWDRRWVMILSDSGAALSTLAMALLLFADQLEIWHIYLAMGISSTFSAFQWLAYSAATTLLIPKKELGRASGMVQIGQAVGQIISPVLAGVLIVTLEVQGIILIDFVTFLFALTTLLIVRVPKPETSAEGEAGKGSLLHETTYGLTYIAARRGLIGLLVFLAIGNFLVGVVSVLVTPLVLAFSSVTMLGIVLSVGGSGMLVGGVVMSVWGGPTRRIVGVLGFMLLAGLCLVFAGLRPSILLLSVAAFSFFFTVPIINGCSQAIWQSKVAPDVQGRVFAMRRMIAMSFLPLAYIAAGPLADKVFEPLLAADGPLVGNIGQIIGYGPGRGMALLFIVMGILTMLVTIAGSLYPPLRLVEEELPDMITDHASTRVKNERQHHSTKLKTEAL